MRSDLTLALVLDTALDSVVIMDANGVVAEWNAPAEKLFGWTRQEATGAEMASLIIPERYRDAHHKGLAHFLATGEGPVLRKRFEITALNKAGDEFPIELSISPATQPNGTTIFVGFIRDISERVQSERLLKKQAHEARVLQKLTSLAAEPSSLDETLTLCLQSVCELMGWPVGHAFVADQRESGALVDAIWVGSRALVRPLQTATQKITFRRGVGMPGRLLQTAAPIWIADIRDCDFFVREEFNVLGIRCAFGLPIITAGEVVAVLEFFGTTPMPLDESIVLTARAMGDQIGRVIERRKVQEHQALLLAELEHRGKNMLAVVMGIATQTARTAPTLEAFSKDYLSRLASLASTYGLLTAKNWQSATLSSLVGEVVAPHLSSPDQLEVRGDDIHFPAKAALSIGMVLHELTTNAAKYGALRHGGRITLTTTTNAGPQGDSVNITWTESGVPNLAPPTRRGFGSKLIETTLRHELGGTVDVDFRAGGVEYKLAYPAARAATPA